MSEEKIGQIIQDLVEAQKLARSEFGVENILQPGIVKELIMARILGHKPLHKKRDPDAVDSEGNCFEYLTSIIRTTRSNKGSSFQIDRVTSRNLRRITRNKCFYFGFFRDNLTIHEIWKVETSVVLEEVNRQLRSCKNRIAHVNFLTRWVYGVGLKVYP